MSAVRWCLRVGASRPDSHRLLDRWPRAIQPGIAAMYACTGALPSAFAICGLPPAASFDGLALVADLRGFFILRRSQDLLYVTAGILRDEAGATVCDHSHPYRGQQLLRHRTEGWRTGARPLRLRHRGLERRRDAPQGYSARAADHAR